MPIVLEIMVAPHPSWYISKTLAHSSFVCFLYMKTPKVVSNFRGSHQSAAAFVMLYANRASVLHANSLFFEDLHHFFIRKRLGIIISLNSVTIDFLQKV